MSEQSSAPADELVSVSTVDAQTLAQGAELLARWDASHRAWMALPDDDDLDMDGDIQIAEEACSRELDAIEDEARALGTSIEALRDLLTENEPDDVTAEMECDDISF